MDGALLIDKPAGMSSFAVIAQLQRALKQRLGCTRKELPKMGHGGTLDPFATGLLIVCVGRAVKLSRYFLGARKSYCGEIQFGSQTDTADLTGAVIAESSKLPESLAVLQEAARSFCDRDYWQTPPMYSAKKVDGQALYKQARQGKVVERKADLRRIYRYEIGSYAEGRACFEVACSTGTYVRTLAEDLAAQFNSHAYLRSLCRESSGSFALEQALPLEVICKAGVAWEQLSCWVDMPKLLPDMARHVVAAEAAVALRQGKQEWLRHLRGDFDDAAQGADLLALYNEDMLVGVVRKVDDRWSIERMFVQCGDRSH